MSLFKKLFKKNKKIKIFDNGKNNKIILDKEEYGKLSSLVLGINGNNNTIRIKTPKHCSSIKINVYGDNNNVDISPNIAVSLSIDCGNCHNKADNTKLYIGDGCTFAETSILLYNSDNLCHIDEDCMFSNSIVIRCGELPHMIFDKTTKENFDISDGVFIGKHVWVGERVYIMKKVKIPDNCVIGSASVVTKTFTETDCVIAGNPAKIVKRNIGWTRGIDEFKNLL